MKPSFTPLKAFGLVVTKAFFPANAVSSDDPMLNNVFQTGNQPDYVWLYTKGKCSGMNLETKQKLEWVPGDCSLVSPYPSGEWLAGFEEDTEILCISPFNNAAKLPLTDKVEKFVLKTGESITLPKDTKLFIGVGIIAVEDKKVLSPHQIKFSSGEKTVTAIEDTYGFIIL